jgi:hypothetical protein
MGFSTKKPQVYNIDGVGSLAYMGHIFLVKWDTAPAWRRGPGPPTGSGDARPSDACAKIYLAKKLLPRSFKPETCALLQISVTTRLLACSYK